jgi:hypothetical protein
LNARDIIRHCWRFRQGNLKRPASKIEYNLVERKSLIALKGKKYLACKAANVPTYLCDFFGSHGSCGSVLANSKLKEAAKHYAESRNKGQKEKWILKHLPGFFDQFETSVVHRQRIPTPWPHNPKDISIVEKVFYVGSKA